MDWNLLQQLISSLGFPIFIAIYLLWKEDKTIGELKDVINQNTIAIQKLIERLDKDFKYSTGGE